MSEGLESVLRLVAEGRLTAEEAAPIIDALSARSSGSDTSAPGSSRSSVPGSGTEAGGPSAGPRRDALDRPRFARLEVRDHGRRVVDVRVPISLGRFALDRLPGLSIDQVADVQRAIDANAHGPVLDVSDEDGDGVRIVLE